MPAHSPLITTRFDATSTADDVVADTDLTSVRALVTGASSGIGLETARSLARAGAEVTLAVRNTDAGMKAAEDIAKSTGSDGVHVTALDLSDRAAVASFVESWRPSEGVAARIAASPPRCTTRLEGCDYTLPDQCLCRSSPPR